MFFFCTDQIVNILVFVSLIVCIAIAQLSHSSMDVDIGNKINGWLFNKTLGLSGELPSVYRALLHFFQLLHVSLLYIPMFCLKILKQEHSYLYKKWRGLSHKKNEEVCSIKKWRGLFQGMGEEGRNLPVEAVRHGEEEQSERQGRSGFDGNEEHWRQCSFERGNYFNFGYVEFDVKGKWDNVGKSTSQTVKCYRNGRVILRGNGWGHFMTQHNPSTLLRKQWRDMNYILRDTLSRF